LEKISLTKLLLIGPLENKKDSSKSGGTVVLFELFLHELQEKKIEFDTIDTLKENYPNPFFAFVSIVFKLTRLVKKHEYISLHATANSLVVIGPVVIILSKIFNKKTSIRKFAGNFHEVYQASNIFRKKLIEFVLKNSTINFFETKYLVDYFRQYNKNTFWFPNVRRQYIIPDLPRNFLKRFVYVGTINEEKGIDEIITVSSRLSDEYTLDLYGPILESKYSKELFRKQKVNYLGSLSPADMLKVLNTYDVLVLPSYREGYPGVIIEAFSLGIPVVTTRLEGIAEMVEDYKNGLLIDAGNSEQLFNAIKSFETIDYAQLSYNALKSFKHFDSTVQTNLFLERLGFNV
jgi:glycosyltransferase involved in cell wall biosynthesis